MTRNTKPRASVSQTFPGFAVLTDISVSFFLLGALAAVPSLLGRDMSAISLLSEC
jgi:hypothetical protein